ncbi:RlpA-like double-psi beta-barrel-protein domain-containing protein-containing protein, partial [Umbelopsis sp. PMI_123]
GSLFTGIGTWFIPETEGGAQGACGPMESNTELIGALNAPQYGNMNAKSSWCGKKVKVTSGGKSVIITINDACPECKYGSIDLTQAAFEKLGDLVTGVLDISWTLV